MTESELIANDILLKCDVDDCKVCQIKPSTMEMLMEDECSE